MALDASPPSFSVCLIPRLLSVSFQQKACATEPGEGCSVWIPGPGGEGLGVCLPASWALVVPKGDAGRWKGGMGKEALRLVPQVYVGTLRLSVSAKGSF